LKRLIFSLLYDDGDFVFSRNFKRQKVGDINWIFENYDLENVALGLDELIIIDISKKKNKIEFTDIVKKISKKIFIPITVGGGIYNEKDVDNYLKSGADKILLNNLFYKDKNFFQKISKTFGKQFIVGCIDYKKINNKYIIFKNDGNEECKNINLIQQIRNLHTAGVGEIVLQSIDLDGTGMGMDLEIIEVLKKINISSPIILKGGIGKPEHIVTVMSKKDVEAVCTANLFNFIGDSFIYTRELLIQNKINVANWGVSEMKLLKNKYEK
jgi:cyclase